jgi:putative membrane protein
MKRTAGNYFLLVLKGMGMGAADVVPGVSGGTLHLLQEFMKNSSIL